MKKMKIYFYQIKLFLSLHAIWTSPNIPFFIGHNRLLNYSSNDCFQSITDSHNLANESKLFN